MNCAIPVDGLPLPDDADAEHPKVQELRALTTWSDGMVWVSPERHGAMSYLTDRYSERAETAEAVSQRVTQGSL